MSVTPDCLNSVLAAFETNGSLIKDDPQTLPPIYDRQNCVLCAVVTSFEKVSLKVVFHTLQFTCSFFECAHFVEG